MNSLQRVWKCSSLSINTKYIHLYQALLMSVLLYGAETWTVLVAEVNTLEAIHMRCQRQILDIRWWALVSNAEVLQRSGLSTIGDILRHRRLSVWPCCMPGREYQHQRLMVDTYEGRKAMAKWRRTPGRPCNVWLHGSGGGNTLLLSRCGDLRSPGVKERRNCPLGLRDDDDDVDDDGG